MPAPRSTGIRLADPGARRLAVLILLASAILWAAILAIAGHEILLLPTYAGFLGLTGSVRSAYLLCLGVAFLDLALVVLALLTGSSLGWGLVAIIEVSKAMLFLTWRITTPGGDALIMAGLALLVVWWEAGAADAA